MNTLKLKNSWERSPEKDGDYLILNNCGLVGVGSFRNGSWNWLMSEGEEKIEKRFCWIEFERDTRNEVKK